ncbi:MAG TPA: energy transducer TonB [Terriglobia bacterium]|nr:energy transducer TonB [Terriglobia bacterium]
MGVRLALNKSLNPDSFSANYYNPHNDGDGRDDQGEDASGFPRFALLGPSEEERKRRRFVLSVTPFVEALAIAIVFWALASLPPSPVLSKVKQEVLYFHPVAPEVVKHIPVMIRRPVLPKQQMAVQPVTPRLQQHQIQKPAEMARMKAPEISQPKIELPHTPPAPKPAEHFNSVEAQHPIPRRQVAMLHTGAFNPGSMAKATVRRPLREVQTGGFGVQNGIPNDPTGNSPQHVAQLGSFDLPSGPGQGNGTGGANGVRGTVASAGFGNGIGTGTGARPGGGASQTVQQGGFGSVVAGTAPRTHTAAQVAAFKPVVILSKPDPDYPAEARRLHIEGQVTLSVLFGSTGNLRVLRVVQGLGHGMDQAAAAAAERIRFKPAERDGHPVDSTALVHIIFQLAY